VLETPNGRDRRVGAADATHGIQLTHTLDFEEDVDGPTASLAFDASTDFARSKNFRQPWPADHFKDRAGFP
jgi:hypothetical protein